MLLQAVLLKPAMLLEMLAGEQTISEIARSQGRCTDWSCRIFAALSAHATGADNSPSWTIVTPAIVMLG